MNSRRKFLRNSGLAASVMVAAKPLDIFAGASSPLYKGGSGNSIMLLHTAHASSDDFCSTASSLKKETGNALLLNASGAAGYSASLQELINNADYDAAGSAAGIADEEGNKEYKIIHKGSVKIGVLTASEELLTNTVSKVRSIAGMLKEEKGCNLVVCISSLDHKNENSSLDDLRLAKASSDVDVIISSRSNEEMTTSVVLNKDGKEVLVDHAGNEQRAVGKIEIGFDASGKKKTVAFG